MFEGWTSLHIFAQCGKPIEKVTKLIENGANIEATAIDSMLTALHLAAENPNPNIVNILLKKGANTKAIDSSGETPLHKAAASKYGNTENIIALIKKGADVNTTNSSGETPLHKAAASKYGNTENIISPIKKGADVSTTKSSDQTSLHIAATSNKYTEMVITLIENGANLDLPEKSGMTPLHYAAVNGQTKIVLVLIEKGADVYASNNSGHTASRLAVERGHTGTSRAVIYPLHYAARLCDIKTVKVFIEKGYCVQAMCDGDKTPLEHAIAADNLNVAKYLLALTKPSPADLRMPEADNNTTKHLKDMYKLATSEPDNIAASALTLGDDETQNEVRIKLSSMVQSTVEAQNSKIYFAKALFGMGSTKKDSYMLKIMMFNLTFKVRDSYRIAIDLARGLATKRQGGKHVPCDVSQLIMQFAGLLPKGVDLSKIMQGTKPHSSQQVAMAPPSSLVTSVIPENISSSSSSSSKSNNT